MPATHGATGRSLCCLFLLICVSQVAALPNLLQSFIHPHSQQPQAPLNVAVDFRKGHEVPENLFGIFFEEINHAGEGGLYAELINDRSFDGLAYESGFLDSNATVIQLPNPLPPREEGVNPSSWHAASGTTMRLTKKVPLTSNNHIALNFTSTSRDAAVYNEGFWGISVKKGAKYHLSLYIQGNTFGAQVALESQEGEPYASFDITNVSDTWQQQTTLLTSNGTDNNARLAVRIKGKGPVFLDFVSLFSEENGVAGSKTPFRQDLLALLKDLKPGAVRLPGGCYVEGQNFSNSFFWEPSIGPVETRTGHWNGPWRYWSTDGLGLFEYMQLAEELDSEAIWVVNNGVAHDESISTARIQNLVTDTLASLEFIKGSADSVWGSLRAKLGRKKPWSLNYLAIGNEDCGKPFYNSNYLAFYEAIHAVYPKIRLIANCNMESSAPTDLWDWHWYTDSATMFGGRFAFDGVSKENNASIYASEYAVFDFGIPTSPGGNLQGAIAEAGFMTGLERNSHTVEMAAFAPLLVHANHTNTCPSNLIMFDGARSVLISTTVSVRARMSIFAHPNTYLRRTAIRQSQRVLPTERPTESEIVAVGTGCYNRVLISRAFLAFGTPSYHVQRLFREFQGVKYVHTSLEGAAADTVAASAVCLTPKCSKFAIKVVNFKPEVQPVIFQLQGVALSPEQKAKLIILSSSDALDSNSLEHPDKVAPKSSTLSLIESSVLVFPGWSLNILEVDTVQPSAASNRGLNFPAKMHSQVER